MAEYRVDELARAAGTSVRNVRVYQERGLLPPPRRRGRAGVYDETHLARLRLIRLLLQRGYTFATIGELIGAWSAGRGIAELIGLDDALAVPWSDETPEVRDGTVLTDSFGTFRPEDLQRAVRLGLVQLEGENVLIPSPRLLEAGAQLVLAGVPLAAALELAERLTTHLEEVARLLFRMFADHVAQEGRPDLEVSAALMQLRPFAKQALDALLSMALEREARSLLDHRATRSRRPRVQHAP